MSAAKEKVAEAFQSFRAQKAKASEAAKCCKSSLEILLGEEGFPSTPCILFRRCAREPHPEQPPLAGIEPELQVSYFGGLEA